MKEWLKIIKMSAVVISFLVFMLALLGGNYFRTHLLLKQPVKDYVVQNMPSDLSGEEREMKAKSLYFEYMGQPMQKASAIAIFLVAFLVSGYAAGTMSDSHINAVVAAIAGALVFSSQIQSATFWVMIILGFAFSLAGSKIGIYRKQRMHPN